MATLHNYVSSDRARYCDMPDYACSCTVDMCDRLTCGDRWPV